MADWKLDLYTTVLRFRFDFDAAAAAWLAETYVARGKRVAGGRPARDACACAVSTSCFAPSLASTHKHARAGMHSLVPRLHRGCVHARVHGCSGVSLSPVDVRRYFMSVGGVDLPPPNVAAHGDGAPYVSDVDGRDAEPPVDIDLDEHPI
ncbi:hypothetical protein EON68_01160 [archaeon]|nr:MAG: hypothetical protein EON68_01160 [archaeon]